MHLDDQDYHLFIRAEPDLTDIFSVSRERFEALKISPADFTLSSPDFEGASQTEKFDIIKNAHDYSIDFKIKFASRPTNSSYKLEIKFTGATVARTETKRIPSGPSEAMPVIKSESIHYLDGSRYYTNDPETLERI